MQPGRTADTGTPQTASGQKAPVFPLTQQWGRPLSKLLLTPDAPASTAGRS